MMMTSMSSIPCLYHAEHMLIINGAHDVCICNMSYRLGGQSGESASQRLIMAQQLVVLQEAWDDLRHWQARN
jgi:hypothetical protein